jgi:hypothetical protein
MKYHRTNKFIFFILYGDGGPIIDVPVGDVLAHFKGVCAFLETTVQHISPQKDREVICEHLVHSGFMDNYFIWTKHCETQLGTQSIIDERAEENMGIPDDVCSHHDDECVIPDFASKTTYSSHMCP